MAKKISQLTQATEVKSDDVTVIVQDGETKKLPLNMMVTKQDIENKKIAGLAKLDEIEATYENDTYTPTITVKNKSSVKTGEGDEVDYSANVMDGHAKSAILKGQTLVNVNRSNFVVNSAITGDYGNAISKFDTDMKASTTYTVIAYSDNQYEYRLSEMRNTTEVALNNDRPLTVGVPTVFTTNENFTSLRGYLKGNTLNIPQGTEIKILIIEGDYTNVDIPYFEGMQSVKMPVLNSVGKNLATVSNVRLEGLRSNSGGHPNNIIMKNIPVEEGKTYTISGVGSKSDNMNHISLTRYEHQNPTNSNNHSQLWNEIGRDDRNTTFTIPKGIKYVSFTFGNCIYNNNGEDGWLQWDNIQLEEGSAATPYEPHKSNILTVNEEIELRGIGDVRDTLDCLTGEVTERIGEIVLDGSEGILWSVTNDGGKLATTICFTTYGYIKDAIMNSAICSHFQQEYSREDIEHFYNENLNSHQALVFFINRDKLTTPDYNGFNQWLSQNPITIQYQLATEVIKTVDLMPSGTHPSTTPYCWKNGHIQLSGSGLLPNLEYSVVTSRAGQINQNATMIVKNDKRIFDLEILLAGGLVNTTYQALTLQNQVETGLSKVSLNSEKEPDYLLYHMIMKLIEEKAYKLDDLTEKVSVFYLYEKLSDEQFETIYSALYPFVEEEIVEEPVVEELPEVVEDEVIM